MRNLLKLKRLWMLLFIPFSFIIILIVKQNTTIAEYIFARGIYKFFSQFIAIIFGIIPFSIAEIILYLIILGFLFLLFRFLVKLVIAKGKRLHLLRFGVLNLLCILSVLLFAFVILCGTNYYRLDFATQYSLSTSQYTVEELTQLNFSLAQRANEIRENYTSVDKNGVFSLESISLSADKAKISMNGLAKDYTTLKRYYNTPKPIALSRAMSYTDTTGIFIPFTMEANVNTDILDYHIPATMCHELSHLAGYMREDEANYIAYLACVNSEYPEFVYSGIMLAFAHSANALYKVDTQAWTLVMESLSDKVIIDLKANREYWSEIESSSVGSVVASVSTNINNTYLSVNGQKDGVKSYGRMVDLLLAEYLH